MTNIEWTDATWNPVVGCEPVSPGCLNCYAAAMARRLEAMGRPEYVGLTVERSSRAVFNGTVRCEPERLDQPLRWRKPRRIFVCSMSDLFHENVPFEFIDRVWAVMALCPRHTFQVLTKRPERMAEYWAQPRARLGRGEPGPADQGGGLVHPADARREGLRADAGEAQEPESRHAGDPGRWPRRRRERWDGERWVTVPTPGHDWEPPRQHEGTRTISARWRLALMGYPLHWLDLPPETLAALAPARTRDLGRWWNRAGVEMTGNAQVPQCVAVRGRAMKETHTRLEAQ